ncbi:MAG: TetR/AcrR family transcriptional regulator [Crocinitomicaceae bacterium]|nr:TetR/AcrR family transcriptional regulator [Crocinitomicaceae bacterium]
MRDTKSNILQSAQKLFNENGVTSVSLRSIAYDAEISVGNLQYHFKKRDDVIEALYFNLVDDIDSIDLTFDQDLLGSFLAYSKQMFTYLFQNRFFLLDFTTLVRSNQKIKDHYSELSKRRQGEFIQVANILIEHGVFRGPELKNEYLDLYKRLEVLTNFWFSSVFIEKNILKENEIQNYLELVGKGIYPYLTPEGKAEYLKLFAQSL